MGKSVEYWEMGIRSGTKFQLEMASKLQQDASNVGRIDHASGFRQ